MLLYLFIGLFILFETLNSVLRRKALRKTKYEYAFTILWQLSAGILMILTLPFVKNYGTFNLKILILFGISIFFWALTNAFLFTAYKYEEVSVLSPISPLYNIIAFTIAVVFFSAHINNWVIVGFILIICASLLSGFYMTKFKPSKGVVYFLLSLFFEGIAFGLSIPVTKIYSSFIYIATCFTIPGLINFFIFLRPRVSHLQYEINVQWKTIIACAVIVDLVYVFEYAALKIGNVSQVVSLSAATTFLIVISGIIFLKERKNVPIKIIAALLAIAGALLAQR